MNTQLASIVRTALKVGGTAATCVGMYDPALGSALASFLTALGPVVVSGGVIWSFFAHKTTTAA